MVINRERYLNNLIARRNDGLIKVVTGIRRCGKSFFLFGNAAISCRGLLGGAKK